MTFKGGVPSHKAMYDVPLKMSLKVFCDLQRLPDITTGHERHACGVPVVPVGFTDAHLLLLLASPFCSRTPQ
jgi:hypothetical protein